MLDTRDTGSCGSENGHLVVMKNYPPEFKADAVALYESRPEARIRSVAADLGINPETLRSWVRAAGASLPRGPTTLAPAA
ncbi:transposase [Streptomyces sp. LN549]|uniref:transposase n=1 Tax=Streptomyces sp. LN549 TaxID=3112979 RepID=UPI003711F308